MEATSYSRARECGRNPLTCNETGETGEAKNCASGNVAQRKVEGGACVIGAVNRLAVVKYGQHQDGQAVSAGAPAQCRARSKTIHDGHADVDKDDIGMKCVKCLQTLISTRNPSRSSAARSTMRWVRSSSIRRTSFFLDGSSRLDDPASIFASAFIDCYPPSTATPLAMGNTTVGQR